MNEEHVATYIYDRRLEYGVYEVHAVYDTVNDKYKRNASSYLLYDKGGKCVNEGNPYYQIPTWQDIFDTHYIEKVN